jgi:TonB family protein
MKFPLVILVIGLLCSLCASGQTPQSDLKRAGLIGLVYAVSSTDKVHIKAEDKTYEQNHVTQYYDKNGNLTLELSYLDKAVVARRTFTVPTAGELIERVETIKPAAGQSAQPPAPSIQIIRHAFKYGEAGRIEAESVTHDDGSKEEVEYEYDDQGQLKKKTEKRDTLTGGALTTISTYGPGPLETSTALYHPYPKVISSSKFSYEFDSRGNWIKKKIVFSPDRPIESTVERTITYYSPQTGIGELIPGERPDDPLKPMPGPPKIIRKSGGVLAASATRRVEPTYPRSAQAAHITGNVVVEIIIDEDGKVISAKALSGPDELQEAAVAAAKQWTFPRTALSGVPVKVVGTITFSFQK